jgi:hypothetical protein
MYESSSRTKYEGGGEIVIFNYLKNVYKNKGELR